MCACLSSSKAEGMRKTQSVVCGVFVCFGGFCLFCFLWKYTFWKSLQKCFRDLVLICLCYFIFEQDSYHASF